MKTCKERAGAKGHNQKAATTTLKKKAEKNQGGDADRGTRIRGKRTKKKGYEPAV